MPYHAADTSARVGFRPYHATDPYMAASLSGIGDYFFNRPFDPWELHATNQRGLYGIGQNHPFKTTAWHLHGLGAADYATVLAEIDASQNVTASPDGTIVQDLDTGNFVNTQTGIITLSDGTTLNPPAVPSPQPPASTAGVPAGTRLLYTATRAPGFVWGAGDISSITAALKADWGIIVDQSSTGTGNTPTVSLYVHTLVDYGLPSDVQANIDHEIIASGRRVQNSSIGVIGTTPQVTAQTAQSLLAALAQAQASGDTVTAQAILHTLSQMGITTAGPAGTAPGATAAGALAWIENNALWVGLGIAGLILLGPIARGIGRR